MNIYTHFCIFMQNVPRRVSPLLKNIFTAKKKEVWDHLTPEQQEVINIEIQKENQADTVDFENI